MMTLWSPAHVADDLRTGRPSEASKARYVTFAIVIQTVIGARSLRDVRSEADLIALVMCLAVTLIGLWAAFRANAAGDGRAFVERYVCIGVVLWTYLVVIYVAIYYAIYAILAWRRMVTAETYPVVATSYTRSLWVWLAIVFAVGLRHYVARGLGSRRRVRRPMR